MSIIKTTLLVALCTGFLLLFSVETKAQDTRPIVKKIDVEFDGPPAEKPKAVQNVLRLMKVLDKNSIHGFRSQRDSLVLWTFGGIRTDFLIRKPGSRM